jgi:BirA family biotin operon repressor/biotin-[acetyl-CoA-carboxylase] ligase
VARIYYYNSIASTNSRARELADSGAASGTTVWAGVQTEGRGRHGRQWHSIAGKGLYCSIILRPKLAPEDLCKITLVAGVAIGKLLSRLTARQAQLKWPNDIYFDGRKCAGILSESSALNAGFPGQYVVVGIGVNVNQSPADFPKELQARVTTLHEQGGRRFDLQLLLNEVRQNLLDQVHRFELRGFAPLLADWQAMDFLRGRQMACVNVDGELVTGIALGADINGNLHVRDAQGLEHQVLSGDVSLVQNS